MKPLKIIRLKPPRFSEHYIKEKVICIRGHRERIFEISTQIIEDKLICHNYGQGGAGLTFLFGCVNESIRKFEEHLKKDQSLRGKPIAVIGAGCYGLLTAILLARKNYAVRIIAAQVANLASYNAAGFFFPRARKCSNANEIATFKALGIESYRVYKQIIAGTHAFITKGPKLLPAYYGHDIDPGFAPYLEEGIIDKPEQITIHFGNDKIYNVLEYKTIFIDSSELMHELQRNIVQLGIKIVQAEIDNFSQVPESLIFNCTGLGAKKLTGDKRIVPVQGHLITLKNQVDLEQLQYMINIKVTMLNALGIPRDELIYYAPKDSGILGVTFIRGQDSLTNNQHEFDRIMQRCKDFFGVEQKFPKN